MSWAEIKKAVNDDLKTPLNKDISYNTTGGFKFFSSSDTFTIPDGVNSILVSGIGAGGGGGGGGTGGTGSSSYAGGAGGAGGGGGNGSYAIDHMIPVIAGSNITVTVGAGGAGGAGASGAVIDGSAGNTAPDTKLSFNNADLIVLGGGNGGAGGHKGTWTTSGYGKGGTGGTGGTVSTTFPNYGILGTGASGNEGGNGGSGGNGALAKGGTPSTTNDVIAFKGSNYLFGNLYGIGGVGGAGSDGVKSRGTVSDASAGNTGVQGCFLICWGTWKYNNVADLMGWNTI